MTFGTGEAGFPEELLAKVAAQLAVSPVTLAPGIVIRPSSKNLRTDEALLPRYLCPPEST